MSNPAEPLTNDPIALQAMLAAERAENERLRQIIPFGRNAESLPVDQLLLVLEEAEQVEAEGFAAEDAGDPVSGRIATGNAANRRALPAHLSRIEQVIDTPDKICPCFKGMMHQRHDRLIPRNRRSSFRARRYFYSLASGFGLAQADCDGARLERD